MRSSTAAAFQDGTHYLLHPDTSEHGPGNVACTWACRCGASDLSPGHEERAELFRTAWHEAGHVVVGWELGFPALSSTVEAGDDIEGDLALGCTDTLSGESLLDPADPERQHRNMEDLLCQVVGGEVAGAEATGEPIPTCEFEWKQARDLARRRGLRVEEAEHRARQICRQRWSCIEKVASALIREATLDEARLLGVQRECEAATGRP